MGKYYLRVEGVNLDNFVYDTPDLSTIRGGGLLLLHAVDGLEGNAFGGATLESISTGASVGLFAFEVDDGSPAPGQVEEAVRKHFRDDPRFRHATFVVDVTEATVAPTAPQTEEGDPGQGATAATSPFRRDLEFLIAKNRWQQMRAPTVAFPSGGADNPCVLDKVRPGTQDDGSPKFVGKKISTSVKRRRAYGATQKQKFYEGIVGHSIDAPFASDFETIGATGSDDRGPLANKIAVVYVDGNSFGALQQQHCSDEGKQKQYDQELRTQREAYLKDFLEEVVLPDPDKAFVCWPETTKTYYRMETLLWGGDEFMLVVPAWKGWETLRFFYEKAVTWTLLDQTVTHAAGLVFCNRKEPIHRVSALAKALCEVAKKDRTQNLFAYQTLESFGVLQSDFGAHRDDLLPGVGAAQLNLDGMQMGAIARCIASVKDADFPRRKLFDLARGKMSCEDQARFLGGLPDEAKTAVADLRGLLSDDACWYHLAELWDYAGKGGSTPWL